jgi:hypothetical protein
MLLDLLLVGLNKTDTLSAFKALFVGFVHFYVAPLHPF